MNTEIENSLKKIKETILVSLLSIWMFLPIFKNIKLTYLEVIKKEWTFICFVGLIGLLFLLYGIYRNSNIVKDKRKYDREMLPIIILGIFMSWTLISCCFSPNFNNAIWGNRYRREGYVTYLAYAGFFGCAFLIKSNKAKKALINMLLISSILNIILIELANKGIWTNILLSRDIQTGPFHHFNHFGYYLLLATVSSIFLFITQKNKYIKIIYLITSIILLYYLIINDTFGCFVALAFTTLFFIVYSTYHKRIKKQYVLIIALGLIIILFIPKVRNVIERNINSIIQDVKNVIAAEQMKENITEQEKEKIEYLAGKAGNGRLMLWRHAVNFFLERPVLGFGPDNLGTKYANFEVTQDRPHNLIIYLATVSGVIGVVTYVTAISIIWIRGLKRMQFDNDIHIISFFNVTAYLISSIFANSMYYISPYFFIFLGMLMCENVKNRKED